MNDTFSQWLLRIFAVTVFMSIGSVIPLLGWFIVGVCLLVVLVWWFYEADKLPRLIMDILDRLTDKKALEEKLRQLDAMTEQFDAEELAGFLKARVIGQDRVAEEVARHLRRRYAARLPDKPIAVFCFAGPPGVGKTYFAKVLAAKLYGDAKRLLFFDMSQYNRPHSASTLFGMTKGYIGSDSYGQLTRRLQNEPASVVLLDEFEKAHHEVRKMFLTAWNDGFITEASDGAQVSTNRAIFILTTNAASDTIGQLVRRYANDRDELARACHFALQEEGGYAPELLSRIDRIFYFAPLEGLDVARVVALAIEKTVQQFSMTLVEGGIDPEVLLRALERHRKLNVGGVRELIRVVEEQITDSLIEARQAGARVVSIVADDAGVCARQVAEPLAT